MKTKIRIAPVTGYDMNELNHIRYRVYSDELGQFPATPSGTLAERTNVKSIYIAATENDRLVGFVGITPPGSPAYSIDHYVSRSDISVSFDKHLYEIRSLTVIDSSRGTVIAPALMYAAFRWIEAHGGTYVVAIGHQKVIPMYLRLGMRRSGVHFMSGKLEYELLEASVRNIKSELTRFKSRLIRLEKQIDWKLSIPFLSSTECYHGGAFFNAIGNTFDDLSRRNEIINADVLDAWFPPCPASLQSMHEHLGWIMRTSPPNHSEGLVEMIAAARGVSPDNILAGGGSSALIFLAFREWLTPNSRVLILDPMYGEYAHVLEKVIGCKVERFKLIRETGYALDLNRFKAKISEGFDLVVWVNPNSPTGRYVFGEDVEAVLKHGPSSTRFCIDETYIDYARKGTSLETYASSTSNVVVVKSMSKVYSLSGLRVGYLCGSAATLDPLRGLTPPWSVGLPAQLAAIRALQSPDYYDELYLQTHRLREQLVHGLKTIGIQEIIPGIGNFILFHLPEDGPDGETVINRCRKQNLFLRDASEMGTGMGDRAIRIAVKDSETNTRMLTLLNKALNP